jgi:bacillolysin
MKQNFFLLSGFLLANAAFAQSKKPTLTPNPSVKIDPATAIQGKQTKGKPDNSPSDFQPITMATPPNIVGLNNLTISGMENGVPTMLGGTLPLAEQNADLNLQAMIYLQKISPLLKVKNAVETFAVVKMETENLQETNLAQTHLRLTQYHEGKRVVRADARLHARNGVIYLYNGRIFETPKIGLQSAIVSENTALATALEHATNSRTLRTMSAQELQLVGGQQVKTELVVWNEQNGAAHWAWSLDVATDVLHRWQYYIDAVSGAILQVENKVCNFAGDYRHEHHECSTGADVSCAGHSTKNIATENAVNTPNFSPLDGSFTATANDLFGTSRTVKTYQVGTTYYMMDNSRVMFNAAQSQLPNSPAGSIWTLNANNTSASNPNISQITSSTNTWNNPTAISAHYNGGLAYDYYKNTFNRNSINGQGGNIQSIINITDNGAAMDNAFWNGEAMFYGNGASAFFPLARGLDVAGHEMTHGVVQATANLEYQGQSGALNESFADIFGAMIDRNDWLIGEDVVKTAVFPSGALRNLQDPHNGGTGLGSNGWQPNHTNEQYTGTQDNGGVHINSGIPNRAYYLFATAIGKADAEKIFYRALTTYLVRSSQFTDLRAAVLQASQDLFAGNANYITQANTAFTTVGIGGATAPTGGGNTQQYQQDLPVNPGAEKLLLTDAVDFTLYSANGDGSNIQQLTTTTVGNRPSVTDNGDEIVFVGTDHNIYDLLATWPAGTVQQSALSTSGTWRSVAISKDGFRIAALSTANDNKLYIFDFTTPIATQQVFTLYNPTTANGGATTGGVLYADALEFDYSGQYVIYDANNQIQSTTGATINYWDIGVINVWNKAAATYATGNIQKLFASLPENTSVGNPVFAKNSPYIVGFDFIDDRNTTTAYATTSVNVQTGDGGNIYTNNTLGTPCYAKADNKMAFTALNGTQSRVGVIGLGSNKISPTGSATILFNDAQYPIFFATGSRNLVLNTQNTAFAKTLSMVATPNPITNKTLALSITNAANTSDAVLRISDVAGKVLLLQKTILQPNANTLSVPLTSFSAGIYMVQCTTATETVTVKVVVD